MPQALRQPRIPSRPTRPGWRLWVPQRNGLPDLIYCAAKSNTGPRGDLVGLAPWSTLMTSSAPVSDLGGWLHQLRPDSQFPRSEACRRPFNRPIHSTPTVTHVARDRELSAGNPAALAGAWFFPQKRRPVGKNQQFCARQWGNGRGHGKPSTPSGGLVPEQPPAAGSAIRKPRATERGFGWAPRIHRKPVTSPIHGQHLATIAPKPGLPPFKTTIHPGFWFSRLGPEDPRARHPRIPFLRCPKRPNRGFSPQSRFAANTKNGWHKPSAIREKSKNKNPMWSIREKNLNPKPIGRLVNQKRRPESAEPTEEPAGEHSCQPTRSEQPCGHSRFRESTNQSGGESPWRGCNCKM